MGKIPPHAKKVFTGEIFDVYQWEQQVFDGSLQTFEALKRPDTVCILATQNEAILLAKELQPNWPHEEMALVGGRAEEGEDPLTSAKRELLEEAGVVSEEWELLFVEEPVRKMSWKIFYYVARNCTSVAQQRLDPGEKIQICPVSFEEFVRIATDEHFNYDAITMQLLRAQTHGGLEKFKKTIFGR